MKAVPSLHQSPLSKGIPDVDAWQRKALVHGPLMHGRVSGLLAQLLDSSREAGFSINPESGQVRISPDKAVYRDLGGFPEKSVSFRIFPFLKRAFSKLLDSDIFF